jgi:hypothetical protein
MDDFNEACSPKIPLSEVIAGVQRLNKMLTDSGRRLVLTVPPDKSTVDTQGLPTSFELKQCSEIAKAQRWKAIGSMGVPGYVDVRSAVEKQEKEKGTPAFLKYDTHWNQDSEVTFAEAVAKKLDPSLMQGTHVVAGQYYYEPGDLDALLQTPKLHKYQAVYVLRDGVKQSKPVVDSLVPKAGVYDITHFTATSTTAPIFQPKTVWIGDSFTQRSLDKISPFFADMTRVPELTKAILGNTAENKLYQRARAQMIQQIVDSKVTVVELVERTFAGVNGDGSMWTPQFLNDLQAALNKAPK